MSRSQRLAVLLFAVVGSLVGVVPIARAVWSTEANSELVAIDGISIGNIYAGGYVGNIEEYPMGGGWLDSEVGVRDPFQMLPTNGTPSNVCPSGSAPHCVSCGGSSGNLGCVKSCYGDFVCSLSRYYKNGKLQYKVCAADYYTCQS